MLYNMKDELDDLSKRDDIKLLGEKQTKASSVTNQLVVDII